MKIIFKIIFIIFFMSIQPCIAANYKILVLPDNIFCEHRDYFIFPESAELIATDIVNYFNQTSRLSAPDISYVKNTIESNSSLKKETMIFLTKYKNNYTINFNTVSRLATKFKTSQVLLITTSLDTQNYILRRTLWDFLNIPGATVTDPAYRLSTQVTLIDANNKIILWQENYQKLISSRENRIIADSFSPATEQLEKIKKYSTRFLSPQITQEVQLALFNINEYSDLNKNPEIVKPQAISVDKLKIDSQRAAVKSGRYVKKETKSFVKTQQTNYKKQKALNLAKARLRKIEQEKLKAKKAIEKQKAIEQKTLKTKNESVLKKGLFKKDKNMIQLETQEISEPVINIPDFEQGIEPVPFLRTRPTLREENSTINDL